MAPRQHDGNAPHRALGLKYCHQPLVIFWMAVLAENLNARGIWALERVSRGSLYYDWAQLVEARTVTMSPGMWIPMYIKNDNAIVTAVSMDQNDGAICGSFIDS